MNIQQLSVIYQSEEDRILLRILTQDLQELQLLFTRKLMLGAWPLLQRASTQTTAQMAATQAHVAAADDAAKVAMADFSRAASLEKADFKTPYSAEHVKWRPLGAQPLLITEIHVTPLAQGRLQLNVAERLPGRVPPRTLQMQLEQALIHGLMQLLGQSLAASGWVEPAAWLAEADSLAAQATAHALPPAARVLN